MDPDSFGKFVAYSEIGIGAALLTPVVPRQVAGAALGVFSAGLLAMYFRNPTMTEADGIRPSQEGMSLAKDMPSWLGRMPSASVMVGLRKYIASRPAEKTPRAAPATWRGTTGVRRAAPMPISE